MNSHRDNVKDAIMEWLIPDSHKRLIRDLGRINAVNENLAKAIFDTLGITEDEQDKCGGYFILHAEKVQWKKALPNDKYIIGVDLAEAAEKYTRRTKELDGGAKYTREEFKSYVVGKVVANPCRWYITLQTPIRKYYQAYGKHIVLEEAKAMFVSLYYPMYLKDYERSTAVDKMDKQ